MGDVRSERGVPGEEFTGRPVEPGAFEALKQFIKDAVDFERVTPDDELRCGTLKKTMKLLARKIF